MTRNEAIALIRPAVPAPGGTWADFGAGRGTFTEALAALLGEQGRVIAIDRDPDALRDLKQLAARAHGADIEVASGDLLQLDSIPALRERLLDGALFANVLHYVAEPGLVLARLRDYQHPQATVCIIEYDRTSPNRWVPYPLPPHKLAASARSAGLSDPIEIGRKKSRFQGELYCVVMNNHGSQRP